MTVPIVIPLTARFLWVQSLSLKAYLKRHFVLAILFAAVLGVAAYIFFYRFLPQARPFMLRLYCVVTARNASAGVIALGFLHSVIYLFLAVPAAAQFSLSLRTSPVLRIVHCRLRRPNYISFLAIVQLLFCLVLLVDVVLWPLLWQKFLGLMSFEQFCSLFFMKLFFLGAIVCYACLWAALDLWLDTQTYSRAIKFVLVLLCLSAVSAFLYGLITGTLHIYNSVRDHVPYTLSRSIIAYRWVLLTFLKDSSSRVSWGLGIGIWLLALFGARPLLNRSLQLTDCIGARQ